MYYMKNVQIKEKSYLKEILYLIILDCYFIVSNLKIH